LKRLETRQNNPYEKVFPDLWVIIKEILINFNNLDDIVEQTCRLVKHSLRVLKNKFDPYLVEFLQIIV